MAANWGQRSNQYWFGGRITEMKRPRYYITKARLSGMFSETPKGLAVLIVASVVFLFAQGSLTPFSVFVSGYTRTDGTRVSSYSRRPPGSVPHDEPYQLLNLAGMAGLVVGVFFAGRPMWRFFAAQPETLVPIPKDAPLPPSPPIFVRSPNRSAKARKDWTCEGCGTSRPDTRLHRTAKE